MTAKVVFGGEGVASVGGRKRLEEEDEQCKGGDLFLDRKKIRVWGRKKCPCIIDSLKKLVLLLFPDLFLRLFF